MSGSVEPTAGESPLAQQAEHAGMDAVTLQAELVIHRRESGSSVSSAIAPPVTQTSAEQQDLCSRRPASTQSGRRAYRRVGARSPGNVSVTQCDVAYKLPASGGRERSQPALNCRAHALTACAPT